MSMRIYVLLGMLCAPCGAEEVGPLALPANEPAVIRQRTQNTSRHLMVRCAQELERAASISGRTAASIIASIAGGGEDNVGINGDSDWDAAGKATGAFGLLIPWPTARQFSTADDGQAVQDDPNTIMQPEWLNKAPFPLPTLAIPVHAQWAGSAGLASMAAAFGSAFPDHLAGPPIDRSQVASYERGVALEYINALYRIEAAISSPIGSATRPLTGFPIPCWFDLAIMASARNFSPADQGQLANAARRLWNEIEKGHTSAAADRYLRAHRLMEHAIDRLKSSQSSSRGTPSGYRALGQAAAEAAWSSFSAIAVSLTEHSDLADQEWQSAGNVAGLCACLWKTRFVNERTGTDGISLASPGQLEGPTDLDLLDNLAEGVADGMHLAAVGTYRVGEATDLLYDIYVERINNDVTTLRKRAHSECKHPKWFDHSRYRYLCDMITKASAAAKERARDVSIARYQGVYLAISNGMFGASSKGLEEAVKTIGRAPQSKGNASGKSNGNNATLRVLSCMAADRSAVACADGALQAMILRRGSTIHDVNAADASAIVGKACAIITNAVDAMALTGNCDRSAVSSALDDLGNSVHPICLALASFLSGYDAVFAHQMTDSVDSEYTPVVAAVADLGEEVVAYSALRQRLYVKMKECANKMALVARGEKDKAVEAQTLEQAIEELKASIRLHYDEATGCGSMPGRIIALRNQLMRYYDPKGKPLGDFINLRVDDIKAAGMPITPYAQAREIGEAIIAASPKTGVTKNNEPNRRQNLLSTAMREQLASRISAAGALLDESPDLGDQTMRDLVTELTNKGVDGLVDTMAGPASQIPPKDWEKWSLMGSLLDLKDEKSPVEVMPQVEPPGTVHERPPGLTDEEAAALEQKAMEDAEAAAQKALAEQAEQDLRDASQQAEADALRATLGEVEALAERERLGLPTDTVQFMSLPDLSKRWGNLIGLVVAERVAEVGIMDASLSAGEARLLQIRKVISLATVNAPGDHVFQTWVRQMHRAACVAAGRAIVTAVDNPMTSVDPVMSVGITSTSDRLSAQAQLPNATRGNAQDRWMIDDLSIRVVECAIARLVHASAISSIAGHRRTLAMCTATMAGSAPFDAAAAYYDVNHSAGRPKAVGGKGKE